MNEQQLKVRVTSWPFRSFVATQFLGAFNDNAFKFAAQWMLITAITAAVVHSVNGTSMEVEAIESRYVAIALAVFTAPFILFSAYAGYVSDRFSKTRVIVWTKLWEVLAMLLAVCAFWTANFYFLYCVLFLTGMQATFFSPSKYGILPECLPEADLSHANGILEMTTYIAIITGTMAGGFVFDHFEGHLALGALIFVAIAVAGTLTALAAPRVLPSGNRDPLVWNVFSTWIEDVRTVSRVNGLGYVIAGIGYFWFLGALLQSCLLIYAKNTLHMTGTESTYPQGILAIGIGAGSYLVGRLAGGKVDARFVPLGAAMLSLFALLQTPASVSRTWALANIGLLGFGGGFFIVPLNALLQLRSPADQRGRIIAFSNVICSTAMFLSSGVLIALTSGLHLRVTQVFTALGVATLAGTAYIVWLRWGK